MMPTLRRGSELRDGARSGDDRAPSSHVGRHGAKPSRGPRPSGDATPAKGDGKAKGKGDGPVTSLVHDYVMLVVKVAFLLSVVGVMMTFVFGAYRETNEYMSPSIRSGDLVVYYRLSDQYAVRSVVIFEYEGEVIAGRVVAGPGDTVNITPQGLVINGTVQREDDVYEETTQVVDGVTLPLVVPEGDVFVLGDNRPIAVDSRIVGCIPVDRIRGELIGLFRRRNF